MSKPPQIVVSEPRGVGIRPPAETESERLQDILRQIQTIKSLPPSEQRSQLASLMQLLKQNASTEELQQFLVSLDSSLSEFMGDPRRFVAIISQILSCFETNRERTQLAIQRFLQDRQVGSAPAPFDWTMVDILLSQLGHLAGGGAVFTREMRDSVVFSLFHPTADAHFLQDIVSPCLLLSVGEQIAVVQERMRALARAPLSKVTLLANMIKEIDERYDREMEKFGPARDDL
jgi:hypothetical protein